MSLWLAITSLALAQDVGPPAAYQVSGHIKTFVLASDPVPWLTLPEGAEPWLEANGLTEEEALRLAGAGHDPVGQGVIDARLIATRSTEHWHAEAHGQLVLQSVAQVSGGLAASTGVGLTAPELLPLTVRPDLGPQLQLTARVDRLSVKRSVPGLDLVLGRQPISLGSGLFFAPLDLVNPLSPASIDTEYKPGVDAFRADAYLGEAGKLTAVAAWSGAPLMGSERVDPAVDDLVLITTGGGTIGVTDLQGAAGYVRGDAVLGATVVSAIRAVGVHSDLTVTLPPSGDPFLRGVLGVDLRPTMTTGIAAEVYAQTLGTTDPTELLDKAQSDRAKSGELWLFGVAYGALTVSQEITPLLLANVAVIGNLTDPSALVAPSLSWSTGANTEVVAGAYLGLGARPDRVPLVHGVDPVSGQPTLLPPSEEALANSVNSELGLAGNAGFVTMRAYF